MLPDPLHPAVVHFPIVFAFLLPLFAIGALWMIHRGARTARAWSIPLAFAAALSLSSWVAVETGEQQEDRVENAVAGAGFESHEEAAQVFLTASAILLLIAAAGLAPGFAGRAARVLATGGALALVVLGARVGHTGGQLAYQGGAAAVYANGGASRGDTRQLASGEAPRPTGRNVGGGRDGDDDDE